MKKSGSNFIQDDRAVMQGREKSPMRVAPRLEGVVKNAGIKPKKKEPKPRAK